MTGDFTVSKAGSGGINIFSEEIVANKKIKIRVEGHPNVRLTSRMLAKTFACSRDIRNVGKTFACSPGYLRAF